MSEEGQNFQDDNKLLKIPDNIQKLDKVKPRLSSVSMNDIKNLSQDDNYFDSDNDQNLDQEQEYNQLFRSVNDYDALTIIWSNALLLCNIYNQITCCYYLGIPGFPKDAWLYLEFIMEIVLIIDLIMRFAFQIYLKRQWIYMGLVHDQNQYSFEKRIKYLISSIPTSIIIYASVKRSRLDQLWIAFIRVFKVVRIDQMNQYFDVRDIRTKRNSFLRTIQAIIYIFLITHLLGCFWLFIGRVDPDQENNWMKLVLYDKYFVPEIQKYVDSVFFVISSMTGLGFAYIYPRTNLEYAMQSIIMVVGVSTYANFFGFFAVSIYNRNKKKIENMMKLQESKNLSVLRNFPIEIRTQMRYFYNDLRLKYDSLCNKFDILQELPNSLRSELSLFINSEIIQKVNFFQFADPSFILLISKFLKPKLSLSDNYIIYKGEVATKMYFIKSGIVQVLSTDNKTIIAYMSEGTYFGEIGVLLTQKRTCFVKSRTNCVFFTINGEDLVQTLDSFPIQNKFLRAVAKQRLQTTEPYDLIEKDNDFEIAAQKQIQMNSIDSRQKEIEIIRQKTIAIYLQNYFLLDLFSSIPFDYILLTADGAKYARQYIRLLRLLKFYRINELRKLVQKHTSVDQPLFRICLLFIFYAISVHWFNCCLIYVALRELKYNSRFDGKNLLNFMVKLPYSIQPDGDKMTKWQVYFNLLVLCACYMGSIVYGDIIPFTISEETLGIFQMIIGRIFISFLFAEISSYVQSRYATFNHHIQVKNRITKWMQLNNIDPSIRKRVNRYFAFKWINQKGIEEAKIIKDLPTHLRINVKNYIFNNLIQHSEVFPKDNPGFIATITAKLQRRLIPKNEFVLKQGELATEMFFILKGEVIVVTEDGIEVTTLKKYQHFGEMALLERKASCRSTSIRAATDVVLAVLTAKDFELICFHYPEFSTRMKEIFDYRTKDSLSKGVKISYERKSVAKNSNLMRFLTKRQNQNNEKEAQLSMIEEESKRESDRNAVQGQAQIQDEVNPYDKQDCEESLMDDSKSEQDNSDPSKYQQEQIKEIEEKIDIEDLESGRFDNIISKKRVSESQKSLSLDNLQAKSNKLHIKEDNGSSARNLFTEDQQLNTDTKLVEQNSNLNKAELESSGYIRLWEAPKLLSSVSDLNKYFKNIKGSSKLAKRKLIALCVAKSLRHIFLFLIVLYNIIFIPLQMGFLIKFEGWILFMELLTLFLYALDIVLMVKNLKSIKQQQNQVGITPTENQAKIIHDMDEIQRRKKFLRLNLICTVIGIIPFSWILQNTLSPLFIINFLRVLRLVKIWPFYRFLQILKQINVNFIRWIEVLITYYIVAHVVSGVMLAQGLDKPDIRETWLNRVPSPLPDGVRKENNLNGVSNQSLYIHALYFVTNTISHVAIGDLTTISTEERALNSFIIWNFTFFYAFCFANIASIVGDFLGSNFLDFHEKYNNVMQMISKDKISSTTMQKVNNYYDYIWAHSQGFNESTEIFSELPTQIKYDVMICRYQEAIQNSLIFKNEQGQIDVPMVNSIFEQMKIRIYMNNDLIVKCGSYGRNLYVILDGEALMFGINNDLQCILTSGTHYNNILSDEYEEDFNGKRLCHIVAKTLVVVGVIEQESLRTLFEAYPFWKLMITKLNSYLYKMGRTSLQKYITQIGSDHTYEREIKIIENHLTFSDDSIYDGLLFKLEDQKNRFIYNPESEEYQKHDFLHYQLKIFQHETGIIQKKQFQQYDGISEGSIITKSTGLMGSNQYQFSLEQYQNRRLLSQFEEDILQISFRIEPDLYEVSWYTTFQIQNKMLIEQYLLSFYYVIKIVTGVGQSDMITYNDLERVCFMIMINIGDSLFAFAFGLIASIQIHISENSEFQKFLQKMKQIDEFLQSINFEQSQSVRVEQYYSYSFFTKNKSHLIETKDLKNYLPYSLLKEVIYYQQREILIPMFKSFKSDNLVREVSSVLANVIFMPGDYIIYKDQIGEEMYFIVEGQVQIIAGDKQTVLKTLSKGNYFGEIAIFMHTKRISYVQAKSFCVISVLRKNDLDDIVLNFPEVSRQFSEEAKKRIFETKELEKKKLAESESYGDGNDDNDLDSSFIQALNHKLENSIYSMRSDHSNHSLIKQMKKKSLNIVEDQIQNIEQQNQRGFSLPSITIEREETSKTRQKFNIQEEDMNQEGGNDQREEHFDSSFQNKIEEVKMSFQGKIESDKYEMTSSSSSSGKSDHENDSFQEIRKQRIRQNSISPMMSKNKNHTSLNNFLYADKIFYENEADSARKLQVKKLLSPQIVRQSTKRRNTELIPNQLNFGFGKSKDKKQSIKKEPLPQEIFNLQIKKVDPESRKEQLSIRRQAKKKNQRRLSKISLGKNLMLSQTAGLKLQWTVGK